VSWFSNPGNGTYGASKAAAWALTNGVRVELARQRTQVVGVYAGFIDTDMTAGIDTPKTSPQEVVTQVLDGVEAGEIEVLVGDRARRVKDSLPRDQELIYPAVQAAWDSGNTMPVGGQG
jgi:NAD(P)-dependent dehydrogenase (short-subunit alcohol dehydrogenase family)